jgi:hypothetical protein
MDRNFSEASIHSQLISIFTRQNLWRKFSPLDKKEQADGSFQFHKKLNPAAILANPAFFQFSPRIFSVGIAVAKGASVNQNHAQPDAMRRSRSAVRVAPENRAQD